MRRWTSGRILLVFLTAAVLLLAGRGLEPSVDWALRGRPLGVEQPVLRIGIDASYAPFAYVDGSGELRGLEVDLAGALAARLGVRAELRNVDLGNGLEEVAVGELDLALAGLVPNRETEWQVWYSEPYLETGTVLVATRAPLGREALSGRVGVERGSMAELALREHQAAGGARVPWLRLSTAIALLEGREVDALALDRVTALRLVHARPGWRMSGSPLERQPFAIAVPRTERDLLHSVNAALAALRAAGYLAELERTWLVAGEGSG